MMFEESRVLHRVEQRMVRVVVRADRLVEAIGRGWDWLFDRAWERVEVWQTHRRARRTEAKIPARAALDQEDEG